MLHDPAFGWVGTATLRDGRAVFVRPPRLGDEPLIQSFVRGLSVQSRYQRFFLPLRELSADHLKRLACADPRSQTALLAFDPGVANVSSIAGMGEYASEAGSDTCELAVVVGESWRRQGLALSLMEDLRDIAIANGFARAVIEVLRDNLPALELARRFGARRNEGARPFGGSLDARSIVRLTVSLDVPTAHCAICRDAVRRDPIGARGPSWASRSSTSATYP